MTPQEAVSQILTTVADAAGVGVNLLELEQRASTMMEILNVKSANLGYHPQWATRPFPGVLCLGVNDVIAHAIPKDYTLKDGDVLHVDCGIVISGMCGDAGMTIPIGTVDPKTERLLRYAKRALYEGIRAVKHGVSVCDIGDAIYYYAKTMGYVVNQVMVGHGIGATMHEGIRIPHVAIPDKFREGQPVLQAGQVICLEPMLTYKDYDGMLDEDGWTLRTRDGRTSAFFEHMLQVTETGCDILTTHIKERDDDDVKV